MDEIGRGTSTFDGLALAHAIAARLMTHNRAFTLFATHYFELTQLAQRHPQAINRHLAAAEHRGGIAFLHEVHDGPANRSYGLQVARLAGLPPPVVRSAGQLLESLEARAREDDAQIDLFATGPGDAAAGEASAGDASAAQDGAGPRGLGVAARPNGADDASLEVLRRLREVDPDQLSARAALDLLYELRSRLEG
jgi:DNA mismatch repair protein MutS